jgi:hypothetical protein
LKSKQECLNKKERQLALLLLLGIFFWGAILYHSTRVPCTVVIPQPKQIPPKKRGEGEIVVYIQGKPDQSGAYYIKKGATLRELIGENEVLSEHSWEKEQLSAVLQDKQLIWLK